jgi:hypothetical protein
MEDAPMQSESPIKQLRARAKARYDARLEAAKREYKQALAAIDSVAELLSEAHDPAENETSVQNCKGRGSLAGAIRAAIADVPPRFTIRDVAAVLERDHPAILGASASSTVSSALRRLAEGNGGISLVERGRGKRASVYAKKDEYSLLANKAQIPFPSGWERGEHEQKIG